MQNHAPQVRAKVLWQTGLMDDLCPPSAQFAAYNKLVFAQKRSSCTPSTHELITYANDEIFTFSGSCKGKTDCF